MKPNRVLYLLLALALAGNFWQYSGAAPRVPKAGYENSITSSATGADALTKSDVTVYSPPLKALFVGTTGDVAVILDDDTVAVTFKNIPSGTLLPLRCKQVMSTNTTASDMVALY